MNQQLAEANKKLLLEEQKKIRGVLGREDINDGKGEFPGDYKPKYDELGTEEGDNASEVENFGNQLAVTEDLELKLTSIEKALQRIEDGTYGKCIEGDDIEEDRLRALPDAETCIKHAK